MSVTEHINGHEVKRHKKGDIDSYKYKCVKCNGLADKKEDFEDTNCEE